MHCYENELPRGFYDTISSPLVTMTTSRKKRKLGPTSTVNTEVIFNGTPGIIGSGKFDLQNVFSHELTQILTSLFLDDDIMRPASSNSKLKAFFQVE